MIRDDGVVCFERLLEDAVDRLVQRQRITMRRRLDELARREIHAPSPREQRSQDLRLAHARTSGQDGDVVFGQPLLERGQRGLLYRRQDWHADLVSGAHEPSLSTLAPSDSHRTAANRALEICGFTKEGVLREAAFHLGEVHDIAMYSLLRREWEQGRVVA